MRQFMVSLLFLTSFPVHGMAETTLFCEHKTAWFISQGQVFPASGSNTLKFNALEVTDIDIPCAKVMANNINESEIYLACERIEKCSTKDEQVWWSFSINRMNAEFEMYQACIGLVIRGTCEVAKAKF